MPSVDFHRIARDHRLRVYQQALQLTRDRDQAQDLTQDTFERCLRRMPARVPDDKVLSWMMVVMRHLFVDEVRSLATRRRVTRHIQVLVDVAPAEGDDEPSWQLVPLEEVRRAVNTLPEALRRPYELHVFVNLRYREVAQRLQLPTKTVGTRIHRARRRLKGLLRPPVAGA
jgi:RNA polymerase sigma-70 factor (ECF subfamily)